LQLPNHHHHYHHHHHHHLATATLKHINIAINITLVGNLQCVELAG
jgi:hypothetical protein